MSIMDHSQNPCPGLVRIEVASRNYGYTTAHVVVVVAYRGLVSPLCMLIYTIQKVILGTI